MSNYIISLFNLIPPIVYDGLLLIMIVGVVLTLWIKGLSKGWRICIGIVLMAYIFYIYASTVLFRTYQSSRGHNFNPFWSYSAIIDGKENVLAESILNVLVFIPMGLLFGLVSRNIRWSTVFVVILCISISIESLQYLTKRGFAEFDDVAHNVLGGMIGYGLFCITRYGYEKILKCHMTVL